MEIKASDVKALRDKTGAGMMECKKALVDSNGDPAAAEKLLKEKGLAAVAKRSDRATGEGRIFVKQDGNKIAIVEMTCETDFVAKNEDFIALGEKLVSITLEKNYSEVTQEHKDLLQELAIKIRENMEVRRVTLVTVPENAVASTYVHHNFKIGAVVVVNGSTDEKVTHFAHECCLHLAVNSPAYITKAEVPQEYIAEQEEIFKNQMAEDPKMAGKPAIFCFLCLGVSVFMLLLMRFLRTQGRRLRCRTLPAPQFFLWSVPLLLLLLPLPVAR